MILRAALLLIFCLAVAPVRAGETDLYTLEGKFEQGGLVMGKTAPGATVTFDGVRLPVAEDGRFVFGFDRDAGPTASLKVTLADGRTASGELSVASRTYNVQRIDGLPPKYVSPPAETLARIKKEGALKRAARPDDTDETWYADGFIWPASGRISGVYGSQRFYNGEARRPHYGVDIAAPSGTPVVAPAAGIITLAEPDMYYEGGLIFIDHGQGVIGVLMHLSRVDVKVGQQVAQGDKVGEIGSTGRSTGAHLDWRMFWRKAHVDPTLLVPPMN